MNIKRKKIIMGVNVYSLKNNSQGIGDYIRGCFCMIQVLSKLNIPFDMDISHAIQRWLRPTNHYIHINLEQINNLHCNRDDRLTFIEEKINKASGIYTFFSNEYPIYPIKDIERNFIRNKLIPSDSMNTYVQNTKKKWGITGPYNIIHLRCGDNCLVDGETPNYDLFINEIQQIKLNSVPYIILSDSYQMKLHLHKLYSSFVVPLDIPVHTCHCNNDEQVKDTMRDFFLFTSASQVYSFSVYGHGSGFSEWACQLYNIPYHAKYLHN